MSILNEFSPTTSHNIANKHTPQIAQFPIFSFLLAIRANCEHPSTSAYFASDGPLEIGFGDRKRIQVEVVALINDTVGTMVAAAYEAKACDLGVIIGE
ncbi:hypothetical protein ANCCAN_28224 [Ancylostoma caninum]|uniref:Hexokinase N-terminal domain-containing protein n=1 Tax=Ancylostoma caninum TaxID=29170 RepID=A0A368F1T6_ANCCA|nr:hypothetical protein ANCCAN_28224 [Ancylostoma caninum]